MSDLALLWTIQLAPLAAFALIQLLPGAARRAVAPLVGVAGAAVAAGACLMLLAANSAHPEAHQYAHRWLHVFDVSPWLRTEGPLDLFVGFLVDPLNLLMITLVTVISFFVQLFSVYYMAEDASRHRYFAFLSLFSFSMTGLVLSNNLLQTFLFWELVGLTSYLLIGFWYEKESAATAARKAFVLNRLGDLGFYLGIILLFLLFGSLSFLDFNPATLTAKLSHFELTSIGLLVFMGVMGKSAQFPLHVWLPDAMEGPTPVSALIHSATMVAAGVFLLCRGFGLFSASHTTLQVVLVIGTLTALVGATMAVIQRDIKRIMAYSTVSQLGLMVMAVGAGSSVAAMFHLTTHAFFKSMLFLTSGAFIHHFHTNDIWEIAKKGGRRDRLTMAALAIGLLSLSGVFPFSGFFSKDLILESILHHSGPVFFGIGLFVSFLTVYYSTRLFLVLARGEEPAHGKHAHDDGHGSHESKLHTLSRAIPLVSLALLSLFAGALGTPLLGSRLLHWLGGEHAPMNMMLIGSTTAVIVAGAGLGWMRFKNPREAAARLDSGKEPLQRLLERKFYMDDLYEFLVKRVGLRIGAVLDWFDRRVINGLMVNETSYSIAKLGRALTRVQTGLLQDYLSWALAVGLAAMVALWAWKGGAI